MDRVAGPGELRRAASAQDGAGPGRVGTDPAAHVPPHAGVLASPARSERAAAQLARLAELATDPDAASIFRASAAAVRRSALPPFAGTPSWEVAFKEDPRRPSVLKGTLERKVRGADDKQRLHLLFRPQSPEIQPFPIPADVVTGLPSGARLSIKVEKGALDERVYRVVASETDHVRTFVARVEVHDGEVLAVGQGLLSPYASIPLGAVARHLEGQSIVARVEHPGLPTRTATVEEVLGVSDGPRARFLEAAADAGCDLEFPSAVMEELAALKADPGIEGKDLTDIPFVTIDNDDSMDLDQAVSIRRNGDGFQVFYAIADAQHFVREGGAIDAEARRRALTTYLPDRSIPMLPRELSEDLCSLVEGQRRRAFVVRLDLDSAGKVTGTSFERGVIESRAKLSYNRVQRFHDAGPKQREGALSGRDFTETLELLREVGGLRIKEARARGVVESADREARIEPVAARPGSKGPRAEGGEGGGALRFALSQRSRNQVEKWNEQVSLLANEAVGRFIAGAGARVLHRVHPEPEVERVEAFRAKVGAIGVEWPREQELSEYMARLDEADPRTKAIRRLSARINRKATYDIEPLGHAALKLDFYDHFTAPMRRYPDIVAHRVLAALIERQGSVTGAGPAGGAASDDLPHQDVKELDAIVGRVEAAHRRNREVAGRCQALMLAEMMKDELFSRKLGTVVDVGPEGAMVQLDRPEVIIPMTAAAMRSVGGGNYTLGQDGVTLEGPAAKVTLGSVVEVTLIWADPQSGIVDAVPSTLLRDAA